MFPLDLETKLASFSVSVSLNVYTLKKDTNTMELRLSLILIFCVVAKTGIMASTLSDANADLTRIMLETLATSQVITISIY